MKNAILPLFLFVAIPFMAYSQATKLRLSDYPVLITNNQPFSMRIDAVDANGNIDVNYNGPIILDFLDCEGTLQRDAATFENGIALINNIRITSPSADGVGYFKLQAKSNDLTPDNTVTMAMGLNPQTHIDESFEGDLPAWTGIEKWKLDDANPISGAKSLKHNGNSATKDTLLFSLPDTLKGQAVEWQFTMRNGKWTTTTSNYFYMVLAASESDISNKNGYGMAVGIVGTTGKDKKIELWEFQGTTRRTLIASDTLWGENRSINLRAALMPNGKLSMWLKPSTIDHWQLIGSTEISTTITPSVGGFIFVCSATRAGQLHIDNVQIRSMEFPGAPAPQPTLGTWGQLVISEIMPHEKAETLHKRKYIELYNPTAEPVNIAGWRFRRNDKLATLPTTTIEPGEYALLCFSAAAATNMAEYGKTIFVDNSVAPLVDGATLKLLNAEGGLVSLVQYSKAWYVPSELANTNSLEVIDLSNLSGDMSNWAASADSKGGTPCAPNSVAASNPDQLPFTATCWATDPTHVYIAFSRLLNPQKAGQNAMYNISNSIGEPYEVMVSDNYDAVELTLSKALAEGQRYRLTMADSLTDISGLPLDNRELELVLPSAAQPNDVIINEILFNAPTGGTKYVELYNRSDRTFDLSTMLLARRSTKDSIDQPYAASVKPHILWPGDYAVISTSSELVQQHYTVRNPAALVEVPKIPTYAQDGGSVILLDTAKRIIDEVRYTAKMHNRLLSNVKGVALERINPNAPSAEPTSWQSAAAAAGFGTPTYRNSQHSDEAAPKATGAFALAPETFSPDGDGYNDYLLLTYKLPEPGYLANIRIFSSAGVEVYRLGNNLTLGTEGQLRWDGNNNNGSRVPVGIYIVHVEYFNLSGKVEHQKLVCVVARK